MAFIDPRPGDPGLRFALHQPPVIAAGIEGAEQRQLLAEDTLGVAGKPFGAKHRTAVTGKGMQKRCLGCRGRVGVIADDIRQRYCGNVNGMFKDAPDIMLNVPGGSGQRL